MSEQQRPQLRAAVVGAGGIGGSLAAHLLAGSWPDLLLVDADADHVAAINASGLHVTGTGVDLHVNARAITPNQLAEPLDVVFLCVKSQHTAEAAAAIAPWLSDDGYVVSVQNGLNISDIADVVGEARVIAGFVNWAADYRSPGHIHFGGLSHFVLGEWDGAMSKRLIRLGEALQPDFPAVITDNIHGYLWSKLVSIALMFSAAVSHRTIPQSFDDPALAPLFSRIAQEGAAVARAQGIALTMLDDFDPDAYARGDTVTAMKRTANHYRAFEKQHTGLYRDLAVRGRPGETAGTFGVTIAHALQSGLDVRAHELAVQFIREVERGTREIGDASLFELRDAVTQLTSPPEIPEP